MNRQVYNSLNFEFEKKRKQAIMDCEYKKEQIYNKHPCLRDIDEQINQEGLSALKKIIGKSAKESGALINELNSKIVTLKEKRQDLLNEYNISSEMFVPKYECSECNDTGFLQSGKMCACYKQKLLDLAYRQKNIELTAVENFGTFNPEFYSNEVNPKKFGTDMSPREYILRIKEFCLDFIREFENQERKNLMFVGETGRGKTFLSNCIAKELLDKGKTVIYQTAPRLLDLIINYKMRFERPENFNEAEYEALFTVDLLIIDDLGTEVQSSARFSELFDIINTRLLTQKSKNTKTILSTNFSLEKLREYYDQRVISRILGGFDIIKIFGEDIRLKKGRLL